MEYAEEQATRLPRKSEGNNPFPDATILPLPSIPGTNESDSSLSNVLFILAMSEGFIGAADIFTRTSAFDGFGTGTILVTNLPVAFSI